jgi:methyl-accepting chemotaxis protein
MPTKDIETAPALPAGARRRGGLSRALDLAARTPSAAKFVVLAALLAALPAAIWIDTRNHTVEALEREARNFDAIISSIRAYYASDVVARVLSVEGKNVSVIHNYLDTPGAIPIPASFSLALGGVISAGQKQMRYRFGSDYPFANRKPIPLDEFEAQGLASLRRAPDQPVIEQRTVGGSSVVRYMTPVMMLPGCVACHNSHPESSKHDWKVGDVRGFQEIIVERPIILDLSSFRWITIYIVVATAIGLLTLLVLTAARRRVEATRLALDGQLERTRIAEELQRTEQDSLERLSRTAVRVAESVDAIRYTASEISQGSSDLAARTDRQASALQETVATMAEIAATVTMNAQNSEQARKLAADALSRAESGGASVSSVVAAMSGIEGSSSRISEIIQVMEEISFQTKLLALNAAVEAARAGESGKGFAVVAQEVRSLADRSRQASQQIRELIAASTREVGQGVKLAGSAGEALEQIVEIVRKVAEIAPDIAAGSLEQSRSIAEINKALADLDAATQQNAALVEESSASAASLAEQASQLVEVVSNFRSDGSETPPAPKPAETAAPSPARRPQPAKASTKPTDWDKEF